MRFVENNTTRIKPKTEEARKREQTRSRNAACFIFEGIALGKQDASLLPPARCRGSRQPVDNPARSTTRDPIHSTRQALDRRRRLPTRSIPPCAV